MLLTQFQKVLKIITQIWKNLVNMLPKAPNKYYFNTVNKYYLHMIQGSRFDLATVSENPVLITLNSTQVSKEAGLDSWSGRFLKDGAKVLAKPISNLCNLSINSEKFPDSYNVAKLRSDYKKGSLTQLCNYRSIPFLPLISKFIEKVIHYQTSNFLNSRNLSCTNQSGFRKKHYTDICLSYLNDEILKSFDKDLTTGMILIDLQKAFDTIDLTYFCKN